MNLNKFIEPFFGNKIKPEYKTELSTFISSYYTESQLFPYNPDDIYQKKGYDTYDDMINDDQVKASFTTKKLMITSREWDIIPVSQDQKDLDVAKFIKYCLEDGFSGVFKDTLDDILSAMQYGFSLTEKIYKVLEAGEYKGMVGIKSLKTKPPHSFEFNIDDYANITSIRQHQLSGDVELNPSKFLIYSYNKQFNNPYGKSDFRSAHQSWFIKNQIIKYWAIYLERHGMPLVLGKYKVGTSQSERSNYRKILERLQAKTVITIPEELNVEFLEAKNGTVAFESAVDSFNTMIARSFLLPELLGFSSHKTGSQALGKEQFNLFYKILEDIQLELEDLINESLISDLVKFNFGENIAIPKFSFVDIDTDDKNEIYNIWINAVEKGVVKTTKQDEDYIRQQLNFPERAESDAVYELPKKQDIFAKEYLNFSAKKYKRALTVFEERNNIDLIANDFDNLGVKFASDISNVVEDIKDALLINIKRKNIIANKDFEAINKLNITSDDKKNLSKSFIRNINQAWSTAKETAKKQLEAEKPKIKFAEKTGALTPKEALNYLLNKAVNISGIESEYILKNVKDILTNGLSTGKSDQEIVFELNNFFKDYKFSQKLPDGSEANITDIKGRLNTVVRTNLNDAYNKGRMAMYNDPNVRDYIVAYQYSAIRDDDTTDFCESYDEKIFAADDPIWSTLTPPNHFNCRSTIIPVFADDDYKLNKPLAIQQPSNFGGKSIRN